MIDLLERLRGNIGDESRNQEEAADEIERLRGLLRTINERPRHFQDCAYWVRMYPEDYDYINAALDVTTDQPEGTP